MEVIAKIVDFYPDNEETERLPDGYRVRKDLEPGTVCFVNDQSGNIAALDFVCPCGCGALGALPIRKGFGGDSWNWNGDKIKPTLTPSILRKAGCQWHGFLTDGVFRSC